MRQIAVGLIVVIACSGCVGHVRAPIGNPIRRAVKHGVTATIVAAVVTGLIVATVKGAAKARRKRRNESSEDKARRDSDEALEKQWRRAKRNRAHGG